MSLSLAALGGCSANRPTTATITPTYSFVKTTSFGYSPQHTEGAVDSRQATASSGEPLPAATVQ